LIHPFSFPLLIRDLDRGDEIADELCEFTYKIREIDKQGGVISDNFGETAKSPEDYAKYGYTSYTNYNLATLTGKDNEGVIPKVHQACSSMCEEYFYNINNPREFYIDTSWVATYDEGCFVPRHTHPNAHLSCVFYAQATEGTGQIIFENPSQPIYGVIAEKNAEMWNDFIPVEAKRGRMIIFPSFMPHYTKPHMGKEERIIFSANMAIMNTMISRIKPPITDHHRHNNNLKLAENYGDDTLLFPKHNDPKLIEGEVNEQDNEKSV